MQRDSHDVLVVGGGLVGASLAIALERAGIDVGLVDPAPEGALPEVFDQRNLSFGEATVNALRALGVLQRLRVAPAPIRRVHVTRRGDFGRVVLDAADHGRDAFGQVVVARDFGEALASRLNDATGVTRYRPARFVADAGLDAGRRQVRIAGAAGARTIHARLLVAADGTTSNVRDALGIGVDRHDYGQVLVVGRVRLSRAPDGTAWERFGPHGPTALLPRGDGYHGVVHGVPAEDADAVAALDEAGWLARLQAAMGWRAGRFLQAGPRSAYPMAKVVARRTLAPRAVLVGNAAQTLHPVGAQGFNLGLRDALALVDVIDAGRHGAAMARDVADDGAFDCGATALLEAWEQRRAEDRARTLAFSDGLARLTSNTSSVAGSLRSLGLLGLAASPTAQAALVGGAMGYRGDTPPLARGQGQ